MVNRHETKYRTPIKNTSNQTRKSNRKLVFYLTFTHDTKYSSFLELITNEDHRKAAAKFRMGNHNLKIETGRHSYPKIPENLRTCDHCETGNIETHFSFRYKLYNQIRNTLYNNIESRYQSFTKMNTKDAVLFLFNNVDSFVCKNVAYFIYERFRIRDAVTKSQN